MREVGLLDRHLPLEVSVSNESGNIDPALSLLVSAVNELGDLETSGPDVTPAVQGLVISGRVISERQWYDDVVKKAGSAARHRAAASENRAGHVFQPLTMT